MPRYELTIVEYVPGLGERTRTYTVDASEAELTALMQRYDELGGDGLEITVTAAQLDDSGGNNELAQDHGRREGIPGRGGLGHPAPGENRPVHIDARPEIPAARAA